MPDLSHYFPIANPTLIFFVVLCIILLAPIIMGKLRIPHIIGMVLAGVIVGEYGFDILKRDDSFELFGKVGMFYIMFLAGLEMDKESMKKKKNDFLIFGLLTFGVPFAMSYWLSTWALGYSTFAALLLSCIMASNTLVAYPIVCRYGLQQHPSVALSVGSTMIALFLSLTTLAAVVGAYTDGSGLMFWALFIVRIVAFCAILFIFIPRTTRWFLRRYSDSVMQFIFVIAMMFLCAALAEFAGLEGILGAFMCGLILNRYIPRFSALMNRIEFIGNAIFIPYFLIGVGMLINVRILFQGGGIVWVVLFMVFVGIAGKALAAYMAATHFRMPLRSGHMMCGLTSAHAAGAIAMVMVGMKIEVAPGERLVDDNMLNGVVIMILFTCIISTLITESAAKRIVIDDKPEQEHSDIDDEKILLPVKYPELAEGLVNVALMMRNEKLNRGLVALNIVYDDDKRQENQERGRQLLDQLVKTASAADVRMQTQVRVAANIANGIKHAFKEFDASEIIMGLHIHHEISPKFWGEFAQSLYNGLSRQIIFVRLKQPINTLRCIRVAVPSRAEFEAGFHRWLERMVKMAENLDCRIVFHAREGCCELIRDFIRHRHPSVRDEYKIMGHWNEVPKLAERMNDDHLMAFVISRKGNISYKTAFEKLPLEIEHFYQGKSLMIIFPDQFGDLMDSMSFAEAQHTEEKSAYNVVIDWIRKKMKLED